MGNWVIQFELQPEKADKFKQMMREMGFKTEKEFFDFAISLVNWALQQTEDGKAIASIVANNGGDAGGPPEVSEVVKIPRRAELSGSRG